MPENINLTVKHVHRFEVDGQFFPSKKDAEDYLVERTFKNELKDALNGAITPVQLAQITNKLKSDKVFPLLVKWVRIQESKRRKLVKK